LENLEEMVMFLDVYDLPKLDQENINYLNRFIASSEIEAVIKSLQTKKSLQLHGFAAESSYNFNEELILMFLKVFHQIER
jgi:hypothetical protein